MKKIKLTQGKYALVDNEDFERLNQFKWCFNGRYAVRSIYNPKNKKWEIWYMHWSIIGKPPQKTETDHINCNGLDNRKENLRIVTQNENRMNRGKQKNNTSGFKGVAWYKDYKKWTARIMANGVSMYLGVFDDKNKAAKAYNDASKKYHKEFSRIA
ncbi:MAG: HNH endonuclease [Nanoarchaeota archaeon]